MCFTEILGAVAACTISILSRIIPFIGVDSVTVTGAVEGGATPSVAAVLALGRATTKAAADSATFATTSTGTTSTRALDDPGSHHTAPRAISCNSAPEGQRHHSSSQCTQPVGNVRVCV
jgi:hypothetical protein